MIQFESFTEPREVAGSSGMAATSQPLATLTAVEILNSGGSAVDAAIAANAMLGLVEPTGCGLGGDLFAIVWDPGTNRLHGLNAGGRSPKSLTLDRLKSQLGLRNEIPLEGPLCTSVPGCVSGWFALHERFGRLEMKRLLAPAIHAARNGFPLTPVIAEEWKNDVERIRDSDSMPEDSANFFDTYTPGGRAPAPGETFANPDLANTLARISEEGREVFYRGDIAEKIGDYVFRLGGFLGAEDFAAHEADWVRPISTMYRGYQVFELPPNSQGIPVLQMLNILHGYDLASRGFASAEALHLQIEAKKLAFEDRARLYGDPDFVGADIERLLSAEYASLLRDRIDPSRVLDESNVSTTCGEFGDTCYLTTADRDGMMVSFIQSNFKSFGSGLVPDGLGFCLQNRGNFFSLNPNHANVYSPGKRPFHTIIPAFVLFDGQPLISFGVMGGAMQPQGHVQILNNLIDFRMSLQEAGNAARWRHVGSSRPTGYRMQTSGVVLLESGFSESTKDELENRGHIVEELDGFFGGYQAIARNPGTGQYIGASDKRKDGMALGL